MRFLTLFLLLLLLPVSATRAQGGIHRCMGADGILVFTDRVCADVNAKPVMPAPASSAHAPVESSPQAPAVTCAVDVKQLKQAVVDAFTERNPNRLAGLTLWNGDGKEEVVAGIRYFNRLMSRPLIEVKSVSDGSSNADDDDADASSLSLSASPQPASTHDEALIVQTESDDGSSAVVQTRFDIVHRSGCMWLRPQSG
jgi:hypothetical protein